jgi:hypothetical protein
MANQLASKIEAAIKTDPEIISVDIAYIPRVTVGK